LWLHEDLVPLQANEDFASILNRTSAAPGARPSTVLVGHPISLFLGDDQIRCYVRLVNPELAFYRKGLYCLHVAENPSDCVKLLEHLGWV